jgi:hypothetical protein
MKTIIDLFDWYYYWLRSLFDDDDKFFGSRQLYLMALTIFNYTYLPLILIVRSFLDEESIESMKPFVILITIVVLGYIVLKVYRRYRTLTGLNFEYGVGHTLANIVFFFLPYAFLILVFHK